MFSRDATPFIERFKLRYGNEARLSERKAISLVFSKLCQTLSPVSLISLDTRSLGEKKRDLNHHFTYYGCSTEKKINWYVEIQRSRIEILLSCIFAREVLSKFITIL